MTRFLGPGKTGGFGSGFGLGFNSPPATAAPTITGLVSSNISTGGGYAIISGTNFQQITGDNPIVTWSGNGTLQGVFLSTTSLLIVTAYNTNQTIGSYDITVTNPDGQNATAYGLVPVTSTINPRSIFGSNCVGWYDGYGAVLSGNNVNELVDLSGCQNHALPYQSYSVPTLTTNNSNFNGASTITCSHGVSSCILRVPSFNLLQGNLSADFAAGMAVQYATGGASGSLLYPDSSNPSNVVLGVQQPTDPVPNAPATYGAGHGALFPIAPPSNAAMNQGGIVTGLASATLYSYADGSTAMTNTGIQTPLVNNALSFFGQTAAFGGTQTDIAEAVVVNSASVYQSGAASLNSYYGGRYQLNKPVISNVSSPASGSGKSFTITGTNFDSSATVTSVSGTFTVNSVSGTTNGVFGTSIAVTTSSSFAAGTYSITVTNANGVSTAGTLLVGVATIASVTNIASSKAGATFRISGTNFNGSATVTGTGTGTITANFISAAGTWIDCTVTNSLSAASYAISVNNPSLPPVATTLVATATANPMTIFGTSCVGWYDGYSVTLNGSTVSAMSDKSGMGNAVTQATSAKQPAFSSSDSNFNNQPSLTFNGSTTFLNTLSFNLFDAGSSADCVLLAVARASVSQNSQGGVLVYYDNAGNTNGCALSYFSPELPTAKSYSDGQTIQWASNVTSAANLVAIHPGASAHGTISINANNSTALSHATTDGAAPNNKALYMGETWNVPSLLNGSAAVYVVLNSAAAAGSTNLTAWDNYCGAKYNTGAPIVTLVTNIANSNAGATFRIAGSNFGSGMTVTGGSTGTITVNYINAAGTQANCTVTNSLAAASYSIMLTNPNGSTATTTLVATATANPMTIFGTACVGWYNAANVTQSAGTATALLDQCGKGQHLNAGAGAGYNATDSNFNNQPSLSFNGSSNRLLNSTMDLFDGNANAACCLLTVSKTTVSQSAYTSLMVYSVSGNNFAMNIATAEKPQATTGGGTAVWASNVTVTSNIVAICPSGASPTVSINVANGTAVTGATTQGALSNGQRLQLGESSDAVYYTGSGAAWLMLNAVPNSTQLANWETYCQNTYGAA